MSLCLTPTLDGYSTHMGSEDCCLLSQKGAGPMEQLSSVMKEETGTDAGIGNRPSIGETFNNLPLLGAEGTSWCVSSLIPAPALLLSPGSLYPDHRICLTQPNASLLFMAPTHLLAWNALSLTGLAHFQNLIQRSSPLCCLLQLFWSKLKSLCWFLTAPCACCSELQNYCSGVAIPLSELGASPNKIYDFLSISAPGFIKFGQMGVWCSRFVEWISERLKDESSQQISWNFPCHLYKSCPRRLPLYATRGTLQS